MILDGKKVRESILKKLKKQIEDEKLDLTLAIIYVGDNKASEVYVNNKIKYAKSVNIKTKLVKMDSDAKEEEVIKEIEKLNKDKKITGIILQSPVPKQINIENCIRHIEPKKDIDGFTKENFYALGHNLDGLYPCTARGIIRLLEYYKIKLKGKNVTIVGRGNLVGKPLIFELLNKNATVTVCHSQTKDLKKHTKDADIIICGAGSPKLLTKKCVKRGAIVVDAGITIIDGKIVGDADYKHLYNKCSYITPNPGGVGPMTIAMILENVYKAGKGELNE